MGAQNWQDVVAARDAKRRQDAIDAGLPDPGPRAPAGQQPLDAGAQGGGQAGDPMAQMPAWMQQMLMARMGAGMGMGGPGFFAGGQVPQGGMDPLTQQNMMMAGMAGAGNMGMAGWYGALDDQMTKMNNQRYGAAQQQQQGELAARAMDTQKEIANKRTEALNNLFSGITGDLKGLAGGLGGGTALAGTPASGGPLGFQGSGGIGGSFGGSPAASAPGGAAPSGGMASPGYGAAGANPSTSAQPVPTPGSPVAAANMQGQQDPQRARQVAIISALTRGMQQPNSVV
jgi:hypothetical protein